VKILQIIQDALRLMKSIDLKVDVG